MQSSGRPEFRCNPRCGVKPKFYGQVMRPQRHAILRDLRHHLAMVPGSPSPAERGIFCIGGAIMARILNDILLFSCIAAFVTGIVLAAASLLT